MKPQSSKPQEKVNPSRLIAYLWSLPVNRITLTAIIPDGPTSTATFMKSDDGRVKCSKWIAAHADQNIYMQDCSVETLHKRPKKEDVTLIHCAHADIDVQGVLTPAEHAAALSGIVGKLKAYRPEPTDMICTGNGVQAYWYLDRPLAGSAENIAKIEAVNKALAQALGGDSCHDVAHLMRAPFTMNHPNKLKASKGRVQATSYVIEQAHDADFCFHRLDDLPTLATAETKDKANDNTDTLSYAGIGSPEIPDPANVDLSRLPPKYQKIIKEGAPTGCKDRSAVVYHVACQMRRAGYSDGEILGVITYEYTYRISDHIYDQKQRTPIEQASRGSSGAWIRMA